eukprot:1061519-Pelagomonas_calceolata.AAC.6
MAAFQACECAMRTRTYVSSYWSWLPSTAPGGEGELPPEEATQFVGARQVAGPRGCGEMDASPQLHWGGGHTRTSPCCM